MKSVVLVMCGGSLVCVSGGGRRGERDWVAKELSKVGEARTGLTSGQAARSFFVLRLSQDICPAQAIVGANARSGSRCCCSSSYIF